MTTGEMNAALDIVQRAMSIEQIGRAFYSRAAQETRDPTGRDTFATLAADEQNHYNLLKRQRDSLAKGATWVAPPDLKPARVKLTQSLFPVSKDDVAKALQTKSRDWDVLLFGMDIETRSFELYRKAALETTDADGRKVFEFLAGQESGHFDILMMRFDFLYGPVAWHP